MKAKVKISRKTLLAINTFRSTEEFRHSITGICLEITKSRKCRVIATDGKRLGAIEDGEVIESPEKKENVSFILNESLLKALPKSNGNRDDVVISIDGAKIVFSPFGQNEKTKFETEAIGATFPEWRKVVPSGSQTTPIDPCFNWRLLEGFTKAASILQPDQTAGIRLLQKQDSAILVLLPSRPSFVGVLMPMRTFSSSQAPDWVSLQEAE